MTVNEILEQLREINQERLHGSFYDGFFSENYSDVDALNTVIILLMYLKNKKPSDSVTIAEIFEAAEIDT